MLLRCLLSPNKWISIKSVDRTDAYLPGDNVTELRTTGNALSVWLANTQDDINDAIIAMALNRDKPCKIVGFLMEEAELNDIEIFVANNEKGVAIGAIDTILDKHRNLVELDYWRLGYLTQYMIDLSQDTSRQIIYTKAEVVDLLNINKDKKIIVDKVNEKLRKHLNW